MHRGGTRRRIRRGVLLAGTRPRAVLQRSPPPLRCLRVFVCLFGLLRPHFPLVPAFAAAWGSLAPSRLLRPFACAGVDPRGAVRRSPWMHIIHIGPVPRGLVILRGSRRFRRLQLVCPNGGEHDDCDLGRCQCLLHVRLPPLHHKNINIPVRPHRSCSCRRKRQQRVHVLDWLHPAHVPGRAELRMELDRRHERHKPVVQHHCKCAGLWGLENRAARVSVLGTACPHVPGRVDA